ncbi:RsmD family RNA methyltransferase [Candidatus Microgenomates bacterium]|nr:RsmD family RNA methyltransferase [Candidatus Microgenomates bacterium]
MKITGGQFQGRQVSYRERKGRRTTSEKVRMAVFNILGNMVDFENIKVVDLFAGSGMYGIEAISRGAGTVTFVDRDRGSIRDVKLAMETFGFTNYEVRSMSYDKFMAETKHALSLQKYDLVFADPPYYDFDLQKIELVADILAKDGVFVLESSSRVAIPKIDILRLLEDRTYGDSHVAIWQKI